MKFIADAMLGRLAKWMRLLGFDVLYFPGINDRGLVKIAKEQDRTILTRDTLLLQHKGLRNPIFVESDHVHEQLLQIKERLDPREAEPLGRCMLCNGVLSRVGRKDDIRDSVPDFVYHQFNDFIQCGGCGKVYWKGSHYEKIREKVRNFLSGSTISGGAKVIRED